MCSTAPTSFQRRVCMFSRFFRSSSFRLLVIGVYACFVSYQALRARIANTLIYTQLVEFEDDDKYSTAVANNVQEARKLLETGFEYVCSHNETMLFRKRK
jgi:hypothetical protein